MVTWPSFDGGDKFLDEVGFVTLRARAWSGEFGAQGAVR